MSLAKASLSGAMSAMCGQDAQLDLRVVGRDQEVAVLGHEGLADLAALLGADRDVLQVGVVGGQAAGRGGGQAVAGVDAAGVGVDLLDQRVGVGAGQLLQLAPVEDHARQLVAGQRQLLQHLDAGGVGAGLGLAAGAAEAQLVEQHFAQLLGRAEVEAAAGELVGLGPRSRPCAG